MKKFLSLVLALVMTMSLVTISAGATEYKDLKDKNEITYEEAVAVMNKIGIISGYEDGNFKPTDTLTRGAAAKIITYMMLGTVAAEQLGVAGKPYKDVALDNTFAPYIAYCKSTGLINGYSDGTFRPGAPLDGYSFSKMLLTALGYKTEYEGFTGAGWQTKVASIAGKTGLYVGNDRFKGSEPVTRQEACLYAFNTLKATEVEYAGLNLSVISKDTNVNIGNSSANFVTNDKQASLDKTYNNVRDGWTQFCEEHFPALKLVNDGNAFDDFGRPANKWSFKKATIGTYAMAADFTFTAGTGDKDEDENFNAKAFGMKGYEFGVKNTGIKADINGAVAAKAINSFKALSTLSGNGTVVEIFTDPDMANTITDIVVIDTQLMTVSNVNANAKTVTLKVIAEENEKLVNKVNVVKEDTAGYDVLSAMKVDDVVLITPVFNGTTYDVAAAAVPTTVTGKLSKVNVKSDKKTVNGITVAGTDYAMSYTWASEDSGLATSSVNTKLDTTVYLDSFGYAIYVKNIVAPTSFILFDEMYTATVDGKNHSFATGYDMSGNALSLDLGTGAIVAPKAGTVHQYDAATKGNAEYVLANSSARLGAVTDAKIDAGTATLTVGSKSVYFASGVKFIFCTMDGSDLDTITVKDGVQTVAKAAGTCTYVLNSDKNAITAVIVNNDSDVEVSNNILYVSKYLGTTTLSNGKTVARFDAYINGDKMPGLTATRDGVNANTFYSYKVNADGNYELSAYTQAAGRSTAVITGASFNKSAIENKAWIKTLSYGAGLTRTDLNAKNAVIVDLTTGNNFNTFASLAEKDNGIKSYDVSLIYNDGKTNANGTVSYLFVTEAYADEFKPEDKPGDNTFANTVVAANGELTTTLAYTRPGFMAADTKVEVTVKVTCNGMNYGPQTITGGVTAANGVYTNYVVTGKYPAGADVKLEIVKEVPAAVNVKYMDGDTGLEIAAGKLIDPMKTLNTDSTGSELSFKVNTTTSRQTLTYTATGMYKDTATKVDYNVTTAATLKATNGSTVVNDNVKAFVGGGKTRAMGNEAVTVTIFGLSKLVAKETYSITAETTDLIDATTAGAVITKFGVDAGHTEAASALLITPKTGSTMTGNKTGDTVFLQASLKAVFADTTNTAAMKVTVNVGGKTLVGFISGTATDKVDLGSVVMNGNYEIKNADVKVEVINKLVNTGKDNAPSITHEAGSHVYAITFNQNIASANVGGVIALATDITATNNTVVDATISGKVLTVTLQKEMVKTNVLTVVADKFTNADYPALELKNVATALTLAVAADGVESWTRG